MLNCILDYKGLCPDKARSGLEASSLLLLEGRLQQSRPATWARWHGPRAELPTVASDGSRSAHFPILCSKCTGARMLAERPSFQGPSAKVSCQQRRALIRLARCACATRRHVLVKCDCEQLWPFGRTKQLSLQQWLRLQRHLTSCPP